MVSESKELWRDKEVNKEMQWGKEERENEAVQETRVSAALNGVSGHLPTWMVDGGPVSRLEAAGLGS